MTVYEYFGVGLLLIVALIVTVIVILLFKKFALNITQQQNSPPRKETQPLIVRFVTSIYVSIKVSIEFTIKIVIPGAILFGIVKYVGIADAVTSHLCRVVYTICDIDSHPANHENTKAIYDTDPDMDTYIKGNLNAQQLDKLDRVLAYEKKQHGFHVSSTDLQRLAANDPAVFDAYARWLQCKSLNRSSFHVVYPDERNSTP
jgi:hypothetical protein